MQYLMVAMFGCCLLLPGRTFAEEKRASAVILETVKENVVINAQGERRPAKVFMAVFSGERLLVAKSGTLSLVFKETGNIERCQASTELTVEPNGCRPRSAITVIPPAKGPNGKLAIRAVREIPKIAPGGIIVARGNTETDPEKLSPQIEPIDGSTVATLTPEFRWQPQEKVETYIFQLYAIGSGRRLVGPLEVQTPAATLPAEAKLTRNRRYRWEVRSKTDYSVVAGGQLTIASELDAQEVQELQDAETEDPAHLALIGMRYEQLGLYANAIETYAMLSELLPDVKDYHEALLELYLRAGRTADAEAEREIVKRLNSAVKNSTAP